jgi:hypothetical protein
MHTTDQTRNKAKQLSKVAAIKRFATFNVAGGSHAALAFYVEILSAVLIFSTAFCYNADHLSCRF